MSPRAFVLCVLSAAAALAAAAPAWAQLDGAAEAAAEAAALNPNTDENDDISDLPASLYDIKVLDWEKKEVSMSEFKGKPLLIVNVASKCGYTNSKYAQLNRLHDKYYHGGNGLNILAFPCNQFGRQEPGTNRDIFNFATDEKKAKFRIMKKVDVNGDKASPVFRWLKGHHIDTEGCHDERTECHHWAAHGECEVNPSFMEKQCAMSCRFCEPNYEFRHEVVWNFESFLISPDGKVEHRFRHKEDLTSPEVTALIEKFLPEKEL